MGIAGLIFTWPSACVLELTRIPEFQLKLSSSSMTDSYGAGTSNLFIMALRAKSIISVFIQLAVSLSGLHLDFR